jgi:hypothetical protein
VSDCFYYYFYIENKKIGEEVAFAYLMTIAQDLLASTKESHEKPD